MNWKPVLIAVAVFLFMVFVLAPLVALVASLVKAAVMIGILVAIGWAVYLVLRKREPA